jgi:hypothetical protein
MEKFDLFKFSPCSEGLEYYESKATPEQAWNDCQRGDWMLWTAHKLNVDNRIFTRAKALCANTVRNLMMDDRSTDAVDAALRYADGEISREELDKYATIAFDAICVDVIDILASTTAESAAYLASTSMSVHGVATYAANATYCAAVVAYYAANVTSASGCSTASASVAKKANRKKTADICRKILTDEVFAKINTVLG